MRYEVNVEIDERTMKGLKEEGFSLYAFKAVKSSSRSGIPTVWFAMDNYLTTMSIGWKENYRAYISIDDLIPGGIIGTHTDKDIDFGQTMNVDNYGVCNVVAGGIREGVVINNVGEVPYTCGISAQKRDGTFSTLCAFNLHGKNADLVVPIEKVLLMFATETVETQTVIEKSLGPGVFIDLTGVSERQVSYDINKGWSWGDESWAIEVPANSQLSPLLTQFSADLQKRVRQQVALE